MANSPVAFMAISSRRLSLPVNFLTNFQQTFLQCFRQSSTPSYFCSNFQQTSCKLSTIFFVILQVLSNFFREIILHYLYYVISFINSQLCQSPTVFPFLVVSISCCVCLVYLILCLHLLLNSRILFGSFWLHFSI